MKTKVFQNKSKCNNIMDMTGTIFNYTYPDLTRFVQ